MRKNTRQNDFNRLLNGTDHESFFADLGVPKKGIAGIAAGGCLIVLLNIVLTLALLAGAVWVVVQVLQATGVL